MIIDIHNLGVIKQATIDLKPLTVFVGPNNSGKTWTAYLLAANLSLSGWEKYRQAYIHDQVNETYPPLDNAIQELLDKGNAQIDVVEFAEVYGETYFNAVAQLSREWIQDYLGTTSTSFKTLDLHLNLAETKKRFLQKVKEHSINSQVGLNPQDKRALLNSVKNLDELTIYFYTETTGNILEKLPAQSIKGFMVSHLFHLLQISLYPEVYLFPTERTTFIALPFILSSNSSLKMASNGSSQTKQKSAAPVGYFWQMINEISEHNQAALEERKQDQHVQRYLQLANILEQKILHGEIDFSTPEPHPQRELLYNPTKDVKLELSSVSSMVKELTPLVLYLRYLARPGQLLIIDEPEMNLHPEAQARLMELLAMMVNAGLHIIFTTHSPYMVDHLSNLVTAASHKDQESIKDLFYLKQHESFIAQENVSVYLFDQGTAQSILDEEGIIHWGTFGDVSDRMAQIYAELI